MGSRTAIDRRMAGHSRYRFPMRILRHRPVACRSLAKALPCAAVPNWYTGLPTGFGRFTAIAGIEPATSTTGNVQLSIYGDDRPLFEAAISGQQPPREIELDIASVKRLKIVVDFGKNLDTGDWLNLCDARLVK